MKVIQLNSQITFERKDLDLLITLEPNVLLIVPDYMAMQVKEMAPKTLTRYRDLYQTYRKYNNEDLNGKLLMVLREGGIGDLIFTTPFAKRIKEMYPESKIVLACNNKNQPLFKGLPFFDEVIPIPVRVDQLQKLTGFPLNHNNTYCVSFERLIEESDEAKKINAYDLFGSEFGFTDMEIVPQIFVDEKIKEQIKEEYFSTSYSLNVVYQVAASSPIRTWKPFHTIEFLNLWDIPNSRVFLVDSPYRGKYVDFIFGQIIPKADVKFENLVNRKASLQKTVALVTHSDIVIGPDSSINHVAGCLGKPLVGIFAAFHTDLRLKYYKNALGINMMSECPRGDETYKSCFEHGHSCTWATELNRIFSPCMDNLQPKQVYAIIKEFIYDLGLVRNAT